MARLTVYVLPEIVPKDEGRGLNWLGVGAVRWNVRPLLRVMVKRILRKHGYPPDKQEKVTQTILEQAQLLARDWDLPPPGRIRAGCGWAVRP